MYMEQAGIERLLRIMNMLTGNVYYTIEQIAEKLEVSQRTIYRYIESLKAAGFVVKKNSYNVFRIDKSSPMLKDLGDLLHFSEEESHILKRAIDSIDDINILKHNLKKKLATIYDYKILPETTLRGKMAFNLNKLIDAIENEKCVLLKNYNSANSNTMSDRIVEPFGFTTNYVQIWAFEHQTKTNKLFKVSRIEDVNVLDQSFQYIHEHTKGYVDIFRISSFEHFPVQLKMKVRAAMLLIEEYPLAEKYMKKLA
jgi:predicted DNA-binding transcriptional regulator YafY